MQFVRLDAGAMTEEQFSQIYALESTCDAPYTEEILRDCVQTMDTFVCVEQGRIVGFLSMKERSARYLGDCIYVVNINVAKERRRRGIAKQMLYAACRHYAPGNSGRVVALDVERTNPALELYRKIGFRELDIPSKNGEGDLVMAVSLEKLDENLREMLQG